MTHGGASGGSGSAAGPGTTPDERRSDIDRRLDASIGTLNKEVRKEQEKTAQERDARAAANAGSSGSTDTESEGTDGDSSGSASTEGPKGAGKDKGNASRPGDLKSEKASKAEGKEGSSGAAGGSSSGQAGSGAGAAEIPDGSDDDVVARRLRKAAEAETDPELKEKLWKEYIEYKKGAGK
jgi:hypothetical protein